jgi:glycosyltransferase involved in cell wall biosynthesis
MKDFKASIIMPTYKRPHTINRAVNSIIAQTYQNWELIVIDNAGDSGYQFNDPRITVYPDNAEVSLAYARNTGIKYATGDLVCSFDDDDEMFPNYLQTFAEAFQRHPKAKMIIAGLIMPDGSRWYGFSTPGCCVRREYITPTWVNKGPCQDQQYFMTLAYVNGWSEALGDFVYLRKVTCKANSEPVGGLRAGGF